MAYAVVFLVAAIARGALEWLPFEYAFPGQALIGSPEFFAAFVAAFVTAVAIARHTPLPSPTQALRRPGTALALPAAVGLAVAILIIVSDLAYPAAAARGVATVHVGLPAAVLFYVFGAIALTVVFHFLPVAALAWIAQRLAARRRAVLVGLGILAIGFSEDAGYFLRHGSEFDVEWGRHAVSVVANAAEASFIYRYGLLAGLTQRGMTYLAWHLAWPAMGPS